MRGGGKLASRYVDVMVTDLETIDVDEELLSVSELAGALALASSTLLRPYLAARTWLRRQLAPYLVAHPAEIVFGGDERGMPLVATPDTDLSFSLSYTEWTGILAVGFGMDVGVAIEALEGSLANPRVMTGAPNGTDRRGLSTPLSPVSAYVRSLVREEALVRSRRLGVDQILAMADVEGTAPVVVDGSEITDLNLGADLVAAVAASVGTGINLIVDDTTAKFLEPAAIA